MICGRIRLSTASVLYSTASLLWKQEINITNCQTSAVSSMIRKRSQLYAMSTNHNHHHHHASKSSNDGHVHRVCVKCMGEGRVVAKQRRTKKSRQQYKRAKAAATRENKEFIPLPLPELRYEQCGCCSGSGLILASKNLDLSHLKNEDEVALREHQHQSIEKHVAIARVRI